MLAALGAAGLFVVLRRLGGGASRQVAYDVRKELFGQLTRLEPAYYHRTRTGDLMNRFTGDLNAVQEMLGFGALQGASTLLTLVLTSLAMLRLSTPLGLVVLGVFPLAAGFMWLMLKVIARRYAAAQEQQSRLANHVQESLSGIRIVKGYAVEDRQVAQYQALNSEYSRRVLRLSRVEAPLWPTMGLLMNAVFAGVLVIGAHQLLGREVRFGGLSLGGFAAFTAYLFHLSWPLLAVGILSNTFQRGAVSWRRLAEVLSARPEISDATARPPQGPSVGELRFESVGLHLNERTLLEDVSFTAPPGRILGITGRTGAGKTLLASLTCRLLDPSTGRVMLDGQDLRELPLSFLRQAVAVVPQEPTLFSDTLAENIAFGMPERVDPHADRPLDEETIRWAADVAGLTADIGRFPNGYQTVLGERGVTLSGGQRQRTAIARAVARRPRLLVLDDALSAVDAQTEAHILARLRQELKGTTVLLISHRLSTLRHADALLVLERGKVARIEKAPDLVELEEPPAARTQGDASGATSGAPPSDTEFRRQFDWALTRRILSYVRPRWPLAALALGMSLLIAAASQSFPLLQRLAIDRFLLPVSGSSFSAHGLEARLAGVSQLALLYLAVAAVEFGARYVFTYSLVTLGQGVLHQLRGELFAKMLRLSLGYFDRTPVGRMLTRVTSDVDAINQLIVSGLVTLAQSLFLLSAALGYMFYLSPKLALISAAALPVMFAATRFFQKKFRGTYRRIRLEQAEVNTSLNENLVGMSTVQLFQREARNRSAFDRLNQRFLAAHLDAIFWFSLFFPVVTLTGNAALAAVLWYGGAEVLRGALSLGVLFAFTQYVKNFFQPLQDLSEVFNILQAAMASGERIFGVLDEPERVLDPPAPRPITRFRGEIELQDVWLAYVEKGEVTDADWVLRGLNLSVRSGESVALVGATGAGKTSIISLLSRFYDPQQGVVKLDGVDVKQYAQTALRRHVGVVLQEVFLFSGTIASNLTLGAEHLTAQRLEEVCRYVGVHEFITSLPGGYQTEVKERGATLSTGQKQLLAFARALLLDPELLLVLDEATASVDPESEALVQAALERVMRGRTSLVIAHRLSTIERCDRIVVLDQGRVVEQGSHAELLRSDGAYATMHRLQAGPRERFAAVR